MPTAEHGHHGGALASSSSARAAATAAARQRCNSEGAGRHASREGQGRPRAPEQHGRGTRPSHGSRRPGSFGALQAERQRHRTRRQQQQQRQQRHRSAERQAPTEFFFLGTDNDTLNRLVNEPSTTTRSRNPGITSDDRFSSQPELRGSQVLHVAHSLGDLHFASRSLRESVERRARQCSERSDGEMGRRGERLNSSIDERDQRLSSLSESRLSLPQEQRISESSETEARVFERLDPKKHESPVEGRSSSVSGRADDSTSHRQSRGVSGSEGNERGREVQRTDVALKHRRSTPSPAGVHITGSVRDRTIVLSVSDSPRASPLPPASDGDVVPAPAVLTPSSIPVSIVPSDQEPLHRSTPEPTASLPAQAPHNRSLTPQAALLQETERSLNRTPSPAPPPGRRSATPVNRANTNTPPVPTPSQAPPSTSSTLPTQRHSPSPPPSEAHRITSSNPGTPTSPAQLPPYTPDPVQGETYGPVPDLLLHSVVPTPSPAPSPSERPGRTSSGQPTAVSASDQRRRHHRPRNHRSRRRRSPKKCCGSVRAARCIASVLRFRWLLVTLAVLGVAALLCAVVLGAISNMLALAIMFSVIGVLLVVVALVAWRCTPAGHEPCHLLFGLGQYSSASMSSSGRRGQHRHAGGGAPPRERQNPLWHGGAIPSEFRNRRPPPTYTASEARRQEQQISPAPQPEAPATGEWSLPSSAPPSYRSRASSTRAGIPITYFAGHHNEDYPASRPPTYRSGASTGVRPRVHRQSSWETAQSSVTSEAGGPESHDRTHEIGWHQSTSAHSTPQHQAS